MVVTHSIGKKQRFFLVNLSFGFPRYEKWYGLEADFADLFEGNSQGLFREQIFEI
jgi:hypothetical protein